MSAELDDLDRARARYPLGIHVVGRVSHILRPGAIGVFVDLGEPPDGWVDVLSLPTDTAHWPSVGAVMTFEVIQHTPGQVRLWPLEPESPPPDASIRSAEVLWTRYPVGIELDAVVEEVFPSNREYAVRFGDDEITVEWTGEAPAPGDVRRLRVIRHLVSPRALVVEPVEEIGTS
ncbi:hypothetical protein [Agromyces sp. NPDC049794]|uniref:hypothetical protein n=1 Tax=unclassified Agromyces TaxID=2639701 RepID=UPI0033EE30D6